MAKLLDCHTGWVVSMNPRRENWQTITAIIRPGDLAQEDDHKWRDAPAMVGYSTVQVSLDHGPLTPMPACRKVAVRP